MSLTVQQHKELVITAKRLCIEKHSGFAFAHATLETLVASDAELKNMLDSFKEDDNADKRAITTDNGIITSEGDFNAPDFFLDAFYIEQVQKASKKRKFLIIQKTHLYTLFVKKL